MIYERFRMQVTVRVLLIGLNLFFFTYLLVCTSLYATLTLCGFFAALQVYSLIRYVEKKHGYLITFLDSIRHGDFTQVFRERSLGSSFDELYRAFNEVFEAFQKTRAEKEEHYRYLQTIVQHVGVGLIAFLPDGEVELINTAAKRLLHVTSLKNIAALESFSKPLVNTLMNLRAGGKRVIKVEYRNELCQLAVYATEFRLRERTYTLVSIHNITSELDDKEMDAWQTLIRVLTHEIMNSVTPISSLASTADVLLREVEHELRIYLQESENTTETMEDIQNAVQTIRQRSQGLLHFVENYRNLTRIPKPDFKIVSVRELLLRIEHLMHPRFTENNINVSLNVEPRTLEITADPNLLEQVLINILINAVQAAANSPEPRIAMHSTLDEQGKVYISITDNGPGIPQEIIEKIFIPFFTTKRDGSGIGLSLSRQIMRMHRGSISATSKPGQETQFVLRF